MQVFSTEQWVIMIVYAYPFFYALDTFLDSLAVANGAPNSEQVMAEAESNNMGGQWAMMEDYLGQITAKYCHESVPLPAVMHYAEMQSKGYRVLLDPATRCSGIALRDMMF